MQIFFTDARTFIFPLHPLAGAPAFYCSAPLNYLQRYTIRPRVRSYGESSTATRSPDKIRIKFLRIFPEIWASTWCLFSSSTRNIAFGSGSITVAITSMASSFPLSPGFLFSFSGLGLMRSCVLLRPTSASCRLPDRPRRFFRPSQNPRSILRHRYGVLEVSCIAAVRRHRGPLIIQHAYARTARVDHRLDRQHHALLQLGALTRRTVIRQLRVFMHLGANSVAYKLAHHRISVLFHPLLHCGGYIPQAIARPDLRDALLQRFPRHAQQFLALGRHSAHGHRQRRVAKIPAQLYSEIHRKNVALAQFPRRRWNPVHHFLVDRSAHRARIPTVAFERRPRAVLLRVPLGELVQLFRRDARPDHRAHFFQRAPDDLSCAIHLFELRRRFTDDHCALPRASQSRSRRGLLPPLLHRHPPLPARHASGNNPPAAGSAVHTPQIVPSRFPADRPTAESISRRRYRKCPASSAAARKYCTSRRPRCTSNGRPPASPVFPGLPETGSPTACPVPGAAKSRPVPRPAESSAETRRR